MSGTPGTWGFADRLTDPPAHPTLVLFYRVAGTFKYRLPVSIDSSIHTVSDGVTQEQVEDLLQNSFQDTANIIWTYNDPGNYFEADISPSTLALITSALQSGDNVSELVNDAGYLTPAAFETLLRNTLDRTFEQNNSQQVSTSTAFVDRHNFNKTPQHTDEYKIEVDYSWAYDITTSNIEVELLIDGNIVRRHEQEPKDSGGFNGGAGTDQDHAGSFTYIHAATASVAFNVQVRFRAEAAGNEASIHDSVVQIERALEV